GPRPRALHAGHHLAGGNVDGQHLALAGIDPAAGQPAAEPEAIQQLLPAPRPPTLAEVAVSRLRLDAAPGLQRLPSRRKTLTPHASFSQAISYQLSAFSQKQNAAGCLADS